MEKKWYASRGFWVGFLTFFTGAMAVAIEFLQAGDFSSLGVAMAIAGVLKIAERMTSDGASVSF